MPDPKDGTKTTLVAPTDPDVAFDADDAKPGEVETIKAQQYETGTGKYGTTPVTPYTPPETPEDKAILTHWIEIELFDDDGKPVAGETYKIVTPDNKVKVGTLDAKGFARLAGIDAGQCQVSFPKLDAACWKPA